MGNGWGGKRDGAGSGGTRPGAGRKPKKITLEVGEKWVMLRAGDEPQQMTVSKVNDGQILLESSSGETFTMTRQEN